MRIFTNRKGDLSLSVNAIVVLVIAIIFLGLAIGFTTKLIGSSKDKLLSGVENVDISTPANSEHPIQVDGKLSIKAGDKKSFKISYYNRKTGDATDAIPHISCTPDGGTTYFFSTTAKVIKFIAIPSTVKGYTETRFQTILDAGSASGTAMEAKSYLCNFMMIKNNAVLDSKGVPTASTELYESQQVSLEVTG